MMVLFTVAFDAIFVYACSLAIEDKKILSVFSHLTRYTFFTSLPLVFSVSYFLKHDRFFV